MFLHNDKLGINDYIAVSGTKDSQDETLSATLNLTTLLSSVCIS